MKKNKTPDDVTEDLQDTSIVPEVEEVVPEPVPLHPVQIASQLFEQHRKSQPGISSGLQSPSTQYLDQRKALMDRAHADLGPTHETTEELRRLYNQAVYVK